MRAGRAQGEEAAGASSEDHRLSARVTEERKTLGHVLDRNAFREVRSRKLAFFVRHFSPFRSYRARWGFAGAEPAAAPATLAVAPIRTVTR